MKKFAVILLSVLIIFAFCSCSNVNNKTTENITKSTTQEQESTMPEINTTEKSVHSIKVKIGDKAFTAQLYDNETARAFADMLPLTLDMNELHGNEKYTYFNNSLPANPANIGKINTGDIMLYGRDCLVLFYDSFSTNYSYTKIGCIENPIDLANAVGSGDVTIIFEK